VPVQAATEDAGPRMSKQMRGVESAACYAKGPGTLA